MSDTIITGIVTTIIGGIFSLFAQLLKHHLEGRIEQAGGKEALRALPTPTAALSLLPFAAVVRDIGILLALTAVGGIIVGLAAPGKDLETLSPALGIANMLMIIVGSCISACLAERSRWKHLAFVALGFWLISLLNLAFPQVTFISWLAASIFIAVSMALGGVLSYLFRR